MRVRIPSNILLFTCVLVVCLAVGGSVETASGWSVGLPPLVFFTGEPKKRGEMIKKHGIVISYGPNVLRKRTPLPTPSTILYPMNGMCVSSTRLGPSVCRH